MSKFTVGDRVVVVNEHTVFSARHGGVLEFLEDSDFPIRVLLNGDGMLVCFSEDELEFEHVYDALSAKPSDEEVFQAHETALSVSLDSILASSADVVNHPSHYTSHPSGVECIEITKHMGFLDGNAMKYLWRFSLKNGVEDLYKCRQYLNWLIEAEEAKRADS